MSTLIADRFFPDSVSTASQQKKPGLFSRLLAAMTASRMAQAQRTIYQYYASKTDAELRAFGVDDATIAHVRKHYV